MMTPGQLAGPGSRRPTQWHFRKFPAGPGHARPPAARRGRPGVLVSSSEAPGPVSVTRTPSRSPCRYPGAGSYQCVSKQAASKKLWLQCIIRTPSRRTSATAGRRRAGRRTRPRVQPQQRTLRPGRHGPGGRRRAASESPRFRIRTSPSSSFLRLLALSCHLKCPGPVQSCVQVRIAPFTTKQLKGAPPSLSPQEAPLVVLPAPLPQ
jgi:hypothetical protein